MKFELNEYHRNTSDDVLLADLRRVAELLGKDRVTIDEYMHYGTYNPSTLQRRFGSWFKTLDAAGLKRTRNLGVTDEEYFQNLEDVWRRLGRQPKYQEMRRPLSRYSAGAYEDRFGNWRAALERFVAFANSSEGAQPVSNEQTAVNNLGERTPTRAVSWRVRFLVMRRDNFKCVVCGRSPSQELGVILHLDHRKPFSKGGETSFENLQTLCSTCNIGKGNLADD